MVTRFSLCLSRVSLNWVGGAGEGKSNLSLMIMVNLSVNVFKDTTTLVIYMLFGYGIITLSADKDF